MSGSGREALTGGREVLPNVRVWSERHHAWSGGRPGLLGVVGRPSRMSGSGREALPNVSQWSGGPHGWSGVFPGCPVVV